jgi:hypothetical protein
MRRHHALLATLALAAAPRAAAAQLVGPHPGPATPYLGFADSPFAGLAGFGYFHLETFEDHLLNVPGVTASAGGVTSVVFGPQIHDSVDEDDGVLDGSGLLGDDYFSSSGPTGISFTFDAAILGSLPTHAGLVWTDGANEIFFEAFDAFGVSLGALGGGHANGSFNGEAEDDRFYGAVHAGGISRIFIRSGSAGIEIDHLQYGGLSPSSTVPEPASVALLGAGLLAMGGAARRRAARRARSA